MIVISCLMTSFMYFFVFVLFVFFFLGGGLDLCSGCFGS